MTVVYLMAIDSDRICLFEFHLIRRVVELYLHHSSDLRSLSPSSNKSLSFDCKGFTLLQTLKSSAGPGLKTNIPKTTDIFRPLKQTTPMEWIKTYLVSQSRWNDPLKQGFGTVRRFLKLALKPAWTQALVYWKSYWGVVKILYIFCMTLDSTWI